MNVASLRGLVDDFHTHRPMTPRAIINTAPGDQRPAGYLYSVGIHPWDSASASQSDFEALLIDARRPDVVAIGECGIDRLRGPQEALQRSVFIPQLEIAEMVGKPVIIHCVRAIDAILALRRGMRHSVDWILHGFRGKSETARQLARAGIYISLGERFNPEVLSSVDPSMIVHETDMQP